MAAPQAVMFPLTRYSVIVAAASADVETRRAAFGMLVDVYWRPVYKYVRLRWRAATEEAEDLTQGFFARAFEKNYFAQYQLSRARFRTFLRTCLDAYIANERQAASRLKRGGAIRQVPLDFATAEGELQHHDLSVVQDFDEYFEREWVRSVLSLAVDRYRTAAAASGRFRQAAAFVRYDLEAPERGESLTYAALASELGMTTTDVTNALAGARREFRAIVLECLRELTMSDEEFQAETRRLLGIDAR